MTLSISRTAYFRYLHHTLADAARLTPCLDNNALEVTRTELARGLLGEAARKKLFAQAASTVRGAAPHKEGEPVDVIVLPDVYAVQHEHGTAKSVLPKKIAPLLLFAKLNRDGRLTPEQASERQAVLVRDLLEPNRLEVSIGTVAKADAAYAQQNAADSWAALMKKGVALVEAVCGQPYEAFAIEGYVRLETGLVLVSKLVSNSVLATQSILKWVDTLRADDAPETPLLQALLAQAPEHELLDAIEQLEASRLHLGQMEGGYGLSRSQREALAHHLAGQGSPILAVDGPPGTGKTTLLLSVIATHWVKHALAQAEPPLIVATSTNNQAVTNILRTFAQVKDTDGPLSGRWLPDVQSYGLYLPAQRRQDRFDFPVHTLRGAGAQAKFDARQHEDKVGLERAREAFLSHFRQAFGADEPADLAHAASVLHTRLRDTVAVITRAMDALKALAATLGEAELSDAAITRYLEARTQARAQQEHDLQALTAQAQATQHWRANWLTHISTEPWWVSLLVALGLGARRRQRDQAFCAHAGLFDLPGLDESAIARAQVEQALRTALARQTRAVAQTQQQIATLEGSIAHVQQTLQALRPLLAGAPLSLEAVQQALDTGPRHSAFQLATHYWEARYLLYVQEQLRRQDRLQDSKSPRRLLAQYQRLAKLHPCLVATLYTLPNRFIAWPTPQKSIALCNAIDLLIVDEAGQVSPEIGVPGFALAKRALVVGDVDQIEPVWSVPGRIDAANAVQCGTVAAGEPLQDFLESGLAASNGSLMRIAQRASVYAKYPERGRGLFLSEHRRCWSEIIQMCNVLVYGGRLQPCREDRGVRAITPSVGYVHIPGDDRRTGGSRANPAEARAIARWLKSRQPEIEAAYGQTSLAHLVAVITPFAAQSREVRSALNGELGAAHGITVGTVHALQGAERRVVIFSPTYGLGTQPGATFIDRSTSMLNVAISRAQDAFLVFGNMHLFRPVGTHPCAVIGRMLFAGGGNEISGVDAELLVPGQDLAPGRLIADLEAHRALLREALETAKQRVVIVSPFLTRTAIVADELEARVRHAVGRGIQINILSDPALNTQRADEFARGVQCLQQAGAQVHFATTQGVHSKLLLVDRDWLVIGSFNWLSAARRADSQWARYESSLRYDGENAFAIMDKTLRDLADIVQAVPLHLRPAPESAKFVRGRAG